MSEPHSHPVPPPSSSASWNQRSLAILCYALFLIGWMSGGLTALIGVIIAFVKRGETVGTIWHSHFQNMITVFFATLAMFLIAMLSWPIALGTLFVNGLLWPFPAALSFQLLLWMFAFPIFALWYLYRMIRGLLRAAEERAY